MKKNFKRNRILLTSLIGLAVLGSATAAFSTWIFGIQKTNADLNGITVEVDTVKDNTAYLDIKVDPTDNKIRLAETSAVSANDNAVNTEAGEAFTTIIQGDFEIKLSTFDFAISNEYTFNYVDFTFSVLKTGETTDKNSITAGASDPFGRTADDYKYIDLAKTKLVLDDFTEKENSELKDYSLYTAKMKTIIFKWGNFFGTEGNGPADFYNTKYKGLATDTTLENRLLFIQNAKNELKAMETAFTGAKIKITARLEVTPITNPELN